MNNDSRSDRRETETGLPGRHCARSTGRVRRCVIATLPEGTARVTARRASGEIVEAEVRQGSAVRRSGQRNVLRRRRSTPAGALLGEELTTVGPHQGERPVHGFATSFRRGRHRRWCLDWHRALRSTVVQVYDWMASYTEPLGLAKTAGRTPHTVRSPSRALRALASGLERARCRRPRLRADLRGRQRLRRRAPGDAHVPRETARPSASSIRSCSPIPTMSSGSATSWTPTDDAADAIGFDGFHVDTYGYPRIAQDCDGERHRHARTPTNRSSSSCALPGPRI